MKNALGLLRCGSQKRFELPHAGLYVDDGEDEEADDCDNDEGDGSDDDDGEDDDCFLGCVVACLFDWVGCFLCGWLAWSVHGFEDRSVDPTRLDRIGSIGSGWVGWLGYLVGGLVGCSAMRSEVGWRLRGRVGCRLVLLMMMMMNGDG